MRQKARAALWDCTTLMSGSLWSGAPETVGEKKIGKIIGKNYRLFFVNFLFEIPHRLETLPA